MKRFAIGVALAALIGLGTANTANAQYIVQYNRITPNGGLATSSQLYNLGTYQSYNSYLSPYGTYRQAYYGNVFGNTFGRSAGFNMYNGLNYNAGFYRPNPFFNPYGGYRYGFYGRW